MKEIKAMTFASAMITLMFIGTGVFIGYKYKEMKDKKA